MKNVLNIRPIPEKWKEIYFNLLDPITKVFIKLNIHPNTFTILGFLISGLATVLFATGMFWKAGFLVILSGICDNIDGKIARDNNKVTKFGALFDSTLDRYAEVIIFFGMAFYFIKNGFYLTSIAVAIGLGGSLMVSYVRARAEGLGFVCEIGLLQRAERLILLGIGGILSGLIGKIALIISIWIIAVLSNVTAVHRIIHVWKEDVKDKKE